ncbi:MAG: ABC transporter ATP-binding protein [Eubacteriales bacterium]|nr:ABC transporter ATP-binding protein [Eubacteriales bacterium]
MSSIVQCRDIYKDYTRGKLVVPVLKHVTFSVEEGDYIAIMGPSGSGKTTLMNVIGCLDTPTSGTYTLNREEISGLSENRMAEIRNRTLGFVFQHADLLPELNALDNVALPLLYRGMRKKERRERAASMLEKVGLGDRLEFLPNQLSGGQCQRAAIARAMVGDPKLLLADEPTGALDSQSGVRVMELFRQLNNEGITIIMITHAAEVAREANKIFQILDGELFTEHRGDLR